MNISKNLYPSMVFRPRAEKVYDKIIPCCRQWMCVCVCVVEQRNVQDNNHCGGATVHRDNSVVIIIIYCTQLVLR